MTLQHDDPELTAYALGELSAPERARFEASLEDAPGAREWVQEIRETAASLSAALATESSAQLSDTRRHAIVEQAERAPARARVDSRWRLAVGIAASVLVAVSVTLYSRMNRTAEPEVLNFVGDRSAAEENPVMEAEPKVVSVPPATKKVETDASATPLPKYMATPSEIPDVAGAESGVPGGVVRFKVGQAGGGGGGAGGGAAQLGPVSETITVSGESPLVETFPAGRHAGPASRAPVPSAPPPGMRREHRERGLYANEPLLDDERDRRPTDFNTESYGRVDDNPFRNVSDEPLSTFSIDVDTASYANVRRFLNQGVRPPRDAVRIEEMINYFTYDYPQPRGNEPFSVTVDVAGAPWQREHRLLRIGLKGRVEEHRPPTNLVFLLDVSGSMEPPNKLPLVRKAMKLLVEQLRENDRVAIVVYAGASGLVLPSTSGDRREAIFTALNELRAGGSTNGGQGIELAYREASKHFIDGGINRVVLATDGDFNVGVTNEGDLTRLIEDKAKSGVFLTVLGFGMGNLKDSTMEKLADRGNGNYAYIDSLSEARKVLVRELGGTLVTIAKDVKIQVEFNPAEVSAFRLIGYENRILQHQDFNDDTKDAGEIGAGHTVTALYEIVPAGGDRSPPRIDPLKYQKPIDRKTAASSGELLTVKLRYKEPAGHESELLSYAIRDRGAHFSKASTDFKFAAAVAAFGMILRDSPHKGAATLSLVEDLAQEGRGEDPQGYRAEFLDLVRRSEQMGTAR